MRHIPSLDGIRAASFLWVFASHSTPWALPGAFGVTVFFFLSGFLITTLMRAEFERTGSVHLIHFWLRRALRILPPFYLVILTGVSLALILYPPGSADAPSTIAQLLFYVNYWAIYGSEHQAPGTGVVWSLAVEEHFYLLFPLLYITIQKAHLPRLTQARILWGLCAVVLVWRCVLVLALHAASARIYLATDTRVDSILFGCALAVWSNPALDAPTLEPAVWKYVLLPLAIVVLVATLLRPLDDTFQLTASFSIQGLALTAIFTCAVRYPTLPIFRVLNYRPVAFIGVLSYSLYLVHQVCLHAVSHLTPTWHGWRWLVALIASFIAALIIYALIERPCARLRRRLTHSAGARMQNGTGHRVAGLDAKEQTAKSPREIQ